MILLLVSCSLISQNIQHLNETVKLVTDRDLYLSNEKIWFGGSIESNEHTSKIIYVDFFDNNGELLNNKKCYVLDGIYSGYIEIPHYAETGYYLLRAYTHNQKNFQEWQLTKKAIRIINPANPLSAHKPIENAPLFKRDIAGRLVFLLSDNQINDSLKIRLITNDSTFDGIPIIFKSGLGYLKNKIVWDNVNAIELISKKDTSQFVLNNSFKNKTTLLLNETNGLISLQIELPQKITRQATVGITSIHSGNNVNLDSYITLGKIDITFRNSKNLRGICQITIHSDDLATEPIYIYVSPVEIGKERPQKNKSDRIISPRIITSVLAGTTFNTEDGDIPEYLTSNPFMIGNFIDNYQLTNQLEDQLSLIVSLKSDYINDIISSDGQTPIKFDAEDNGPVIQGRVKNNGSVYNDLFCSFVDLPEKFYATVSDSLTGAFSINPGNSLPAGDIYISTLGINNDSIEIYSNFLNKPPTWEAVHFTPDSNMRNLLTRMYINSQYNNHYSNTKVTDSVTNECNSPLFAGNLSSYNMSDYIQMPTTRELFNEIIPFVRVRNYKDDYQFVVLDDHTRVEYTNPLVLVDNIYYPNVEVIMNLQPSELASVQVVTRKYFYGNVVFNGIIKVTTTTGILEDLKMPPNGVFFKNSSTYNLQQMKKSNPMLSNTIFWELSNSETSIMPDKIEGYNYKIIKLR